jgi:predicted ATPase
VLTSIRLDDWKSFGSGDEARNELRLSPLTLMVGPNASGKSNVIDALRFLQGVALDLPLADVLRGRWEGQREVWPGIRGHVVEAAREGQVKFGLRTSWEVAPFERPLSHTLQVTTEGDVAVERESLYEGDAYLFDTHAPALGQQSGRIDGGGLRVAVRALGKGRSPPVTYSSLRSVLVQLEAVERMASSVMAGASVLRSALRDAAFLDIRPSLMRDYRPTKAGQLGTSGENVSPVLYALKEKDSSRFEDIVDWLGELCAPVVEAIDFDKTKLDEVMFFLVEKGGRQISARSVSDGTLRFLGELVALLTCSEGSLVVLEEPDVGLHPSRIHLLSELLEDIAKRRRIQILATTHSPSLLAHLSSEALAAVIAFGRDPENGWSVCSRLGDLEHFESLRDSSRLEHLVSTGWLERAL